MSNEKILKILPSLNKTLLGFSPLRPPGRSAEAQQRSLNRGRPRCRRCQREFEGLTGGRFDDFRGELLRG